MLGPTDPLRTTDLRHAIRGSTIHATTPRPPPTPPARSRDEPTQALPADHPADAPRARRARATASTARAPPPPQDPFAADQPGSPCSGAHSPRGSPRRPTGDRPPAPRSPPAIAGTTRRAPRPPRRPRRWGRPPRHESASESRAAPWSPFQVAQSAAARQHSLASGKQPAQAPVSHFQPTRNASASHWNTRPIVRSRVGAERLNRTVRFTDGMLPSHPSSPCSITGFVQRPSQSSTFRKNCSGRGWALSASRQGLHTESRRINQKRNAVDAKRP
jgi:hypothetical protein